MEKVNDICYEKSNFLDLEPSMIIHVRSPSNLIGSCSCRLRVISHLYWWSYSEVFVDVRLFLDKSVGEFSMVYKKCVLSCGLGSIITIWVCNLLDSTRFVLSFPNTLLTFCFTRVSSGLSSSVNILQIADVALRVVFLLFCYVFSHYFA